MPTNAELDLERAAQEWIVDVIPPGLNKSNVLQRRFDAIAKLPPSEIRVESVIANFYDARHGNDEDMLSLELLRVSMEHFDRFAESDELRACVLHSAFHPDGVYYLGIPGSCLRALREKTPNFTPKSVAELDVLCDTLDKKMVDVRRLVSYGTDDVLRMIHRTAQTPEGRSLFSEAHCDTLGRLAPVLEASPKKWTVKALGILEKIIVLLYKPDKKRLRSEMEGFEEEFASAAWSVQ